MTSEIENVDFDLENHKRERRLLIQEQIKKVEEEIKDHEYDIKQANEQLKHLENELEIYNDDNSKNRSRSWITVRRKTDRNGKWAYWWKVEKWFENGKPREKWFQQITEAEYNAFQRKKVKKQP